jgi:hypothetical protein
VLSAKAANIFSIFALSRCLCEVLCLVAVDGELASESCAASLQSLLSGDDSSLILGLVKVSSVLVFPCSNLSTVQRDSSSFWYRASSCLFSSFSRSSLSIWFDIESWFTNMACMGVRNCFVWGFSDCSMVSVVFLRAVADWGVIFVKGSVFDYLSCSSIHLCGGFNVLLGFCLAILFDN